jgi:hypothetical protein
LWGFFLALKTAYLLQQNTSMGLHHLHLWVLPILTALAMLGLSSASQNLR